MLNYLNPTQEQIEEYLQSKGFQTRVENGQIRTNKCPFCKDKKEDWTHFYISISNGLYYCHKCSAQGNIITLAQFFGDYKKENMREQKKKYTNNTRDLSQPIKTPDQITTPKKEEQKSKISEKDLELYSDSANEYHKKLITGTDKKTKAILNYLTKTRGLKLDTLKHFKIGWSGQSISIPIIENGKVINIRYRKDPEEKNEHIPKMHNITNAKIALFNGDTLKKSKKVVITEGEIDAMSLFQEGWESVVSITVGAKTFKREWVEALKKQRSIYLCYDNDEAGEDGVEVAVEKLGAGRCYKIVVPKKEGEISKDLNDFFVKDKKTIDDFNKLYVGAEKVKINYELIEHIKDSVVRTKEELFDPRPFRGLPTGYPTLDKQLKGMREGDLVIVSGNTSVGKTFLSQNIAYNLANLGKSIMMFSLEQPVEEIVERFMMIDKEFSFDNLEIFDKDKKANPVSKGIINEAGKNLSGKKIYFYSGKDALNVDLLDEVAIKSVRDFGCDVIIIDHLHYFVSRDRAYRTAEIGDIVRHVKYLARHLRIPIILICHIRKEEKNNQEPTMNELKDSSAIKQDADIVMLIHRNKNLSTRILDQATQIFVDKNRHGKTGVVGLYFEEKSCRFREYVDDKERQKIADAEAGVKKEEKQTQTNFQESGNNIKTLNPNS